MDKECYINSDIQNYFATKYNVEYLPLVANKR